MLTTGSIGDRLTARDFLRIPDDGKRHELIDGVHYVTPSPNLGHQAILGRLHLALGTFLNAHPTMGRVFLSRLDVILSLYDVVEPDLMVIAGDQLGIMTPKNIQGAPALVVEILSPSTRRRDEGIKRALFERTGVREYWLVDPQRQTVAILRRGKTHFTTEGVIGEGGTLTTPILPGFRLAASDLFADS